MSSSTIKPVQDGSKPPPVSKPRRDFKYGTVPYKIEKPFYDFLDSYNALKASHNELIQAKNKSVLQNSGSGSSSSVQESELKARMQDIEKEFHAYMWEYLRQYKEAKEDYNEIYFPPKRTTAALVDIIAGICKELGIETEIWSQNSNKKTISVYKSKQTGKPETVFREPQEKGKPVEETKAGPNLPQNPPAEDPKPSQSLPKPEPTFSFPPDPPKSVTLTSISATGLHLLIDPQPEASILEFLIHDSQKKEVLKFTTNNVFLSFEADVPKLSRQYGHIILLEFFVLAKNSLGLSKPQDTPFKILANPYQKLKMLISGSDVPLNSELIGETKDFEPFFESKFDGIVSRVALGNSELMLVDGGTVVQWGYAIDSSEPEIRPEKIKDCIEEMESTPFFPIKGLKPAIIAVSVACGFDFCAVLSAKGEVFTWGMNLCGQLGQGDFNARVSGTRVKALASEVCIGLAAGQAHCLVSTLSGKAYVWGRCQAEEGEPVLDNFGSTIDFANSEQHQLSPRIVRVPSGEHPCGVHAGGSFSLLLTRSGMIFSWGNNEFGQLGHSEFSNINTVLPKRIQGLNGTPRKISCGGYHAAVLCSDTGLWVWGRGTEGQLGLGNLESVHSPRQIHVKGLEVVDYVACGGAHTLFGAGKEVWGCGDGANDGLGAVKETVREPVLLKKLENDVFGIECGATCSAILFK